MTSTEQKKCNQCLQKFTKIKPPFKMLGCKHNICGQCLQQIRQTKIDSIQCQFCDNTCSKLNKKKFQPNRPLTLKLQKSTDSRIKPSQTYTSNCWTTRPDNQPPVQEQNLMLLTEQQPNSNSKTHIRKIQGKICPEHEKQLQIICITDQQMVCPHCAIFGNHKDHTFKTVKEFNRDFDNKYEKLEINKQKKYVCDKKIKAVWDRERIQLSVSKRKSQLNKQIQIKFKKIVEQVIAMETVLHTELNNQFEQIQNEMISTLEQQNTQQLQYFKWESECENCFIAIDKSDAPHEKIKLLYRSLSDIEKGEYYLEKLSEELESRNKKIEYLVKSIVVEFINNGQLTKLAQIVKKDISNMSTDNSELILQNNATEIPKVTDEQTDKITQNSFINDFSKDPLPHQHPTIKPQRTPDKSALHTSQKSKQSKQSKKASMIYQTPPRKIFSKCSIDLLRARSNYSIVSKQQYCATGQAYFKQIQPRNAQPIIKAFLENSNKQILDLSHCQLNDQMILHQIKQIKKSRKIKVLKLCNNLITDSGFQNIIQHLSSIANLNLSHNKLTDGALSILISKKDKLTLMKIINLSYNNINEKKVKMKIDSLRKMGIIVTI